MDFFSIAGGVALLGAGICLAADGYGYMLRRSAFRWLSILSLFGTIIALAQLSRLMQVGVPAGGSRDGVIAVAFLLLAGLAQSLMAVRARRERDEARD